MKLSGNNSNTELSGIGAVGEFKLKTTAKAFAILSSGLYTNKIKAIIRELSCNALDSHVAAGTPEKQFDVKIPTAFSPDFYIRDYGVGLSEEQLIHIYTTYFESTKTESNDYIGALGLGSKSPFSYTDVFSVESFFNGDHSTYAMFINEDGIPSVSKVHSQKTTEHNGLKISFAVKQNDFTSFAFEASDIYSAFKVLPKFIGTHINVSVPKYIDLPFITDPGEKAMFRVNTNRSGRSHNSNLYVVQGSIRYPLNTEPLRGYFETTNYHRDFLNNFYDLELHVPLGSCDIAASREQLSYDKATIKFLVDKLIIFYTRFEAYVRSKLVGFTNSVEARKQIASIIIDPLKTLVGNSVVSSWFKLLYLGTIKSPIYLVPNVTLFPYDFSYLEDLTRVIHNNNVNNNVACNIYRFNFERHSLKFKSCSWALIGDLTNSNRATQRLTFPISEETIYAYGDANDKEVKKRLKAFYLKSGNRNKNFLFFNTVTVNDVLKNLFGNVLISVYDIISEPETKSLLATVKTATAARPKNFVSSVAFDFDNHKGLKNQSSETQIKKCRSEINFRDEKELKALSKDSYYVIASGNSRFAFELNLTGTPVVISTSSIDCHDFLEYCTADLFPKTGKLFIVSKTSALKMKAAGVKNIHTYIKDNLKVPSKYEIMLKIALDSYYTENYNHKAFCTRISYINSSMIGTEIEGKYDISKIAKIIARHHIISSERVNLLKRIGLIPKNHVTENLKSRARKFKLEFETQTKAISNKYAIIFTGFEKDNSSIINEQLFYIKAKNGEI